MIDRKTLYCLSVYYRKEKRRDTMAKEVPSYSKFLAACVNYLLEQKGSTRTTENKIITGACHRLGLDESSIEFRTIKLNSSAIIDDQHYYFQTFTDLALEILVLSGYIIKKRLAAGTRFYLSPTVTQPLEEFKLSMLSNKALRVMASTAIHNHIYDLVYYSKNGYSLDEISVSNVLVRTKDMMKKMYGKSGDLLLQELISVLERNINWIINNECEDLTVSHVEERVSQEKQDIKIQLLNKIKIISPEQFEKLSAQLIYALYPKAEVETPLIHNGKSGDMGIDCIVTVQDALGHPMKYYIQCKRYIANNIGSPDLQNFIGSIAPYSLRQGIFMTTAKFTKAAYQYLDSLEHQYTIRLIDGENMVNLMIKHRIGVIEDHADPVLEMNERFFRDLG